MHRPAVFQVADHHDIDIFERTLRFLDRIKVEQRLTRMLVGPVSGIDHRHARNLAGITGRTFDRMTHHDHIAVVRDRHDRIVESFAFRNAGIRSPRKTDHPAPETIDRAFETQPRPCRWFEKQRREYLPGQHLSVRIGLETGGQIHNLQNFIARKIGDRNKTFLSHRTLFLL